MSAADERLWRLGRALADAQDASAAIGSEERRARMRQRFLAEAPRIGGRSGSPRLHLRYSIAGMVVLAAAALVLFVLLPREVPLTYAVGEEQIAGLVETTIRAPQSEPLDLQFSDGSTIELAAQSEVRISALHERGCALELASGRIFADVVHRPHNDWAVRAGPYRVDVIGTAFWIDWDQAADTFEVGLVRGEVRVTGPGIDEARTVRVGETLRFGSGFAPRPSAGATEASKAEVADVEAPEDTVAEPPRAAEWASRPFGAGEASRGGVVGPGRSAKLEPDWMALAQDGEFTAAMDRAEAQGFATLCDRLDAKALLKLADVARYAGQSDRAAEALLALRRRFPGGDSAANAAFDLARLAGKDCEAASPWLDRYLQERPTGTMADEARSRVAECTHRTRSHD